MKLVICETDPQALVAYRSQFDRYVEVAVLETSLLDAPADAIVAPGNSFGFMDWGMSSKISERFGFALEDAVREAIRSRYACEMLVGQAEVFSTGARPAYVVYAPVFRTPQSIHRTVNAYLAARGVFLAVKAFNQGGTGSIDTIAFSDLGSGAAKLSPFIAARQIRYAYEEASGLRKIPKKNITPFLRREKKLKEMPLLGRGGQPQEEEDEQDVEE